MPMKINAKRVKMALRSPGHFLYALRHVARSGPLGRLEKLLPGGRALKPNIILINLTGRCNLRCAMCMQPRDHADQGDSQTISRGQEELTPQQWENVIDQAAPARPAFFLTGGEPLIYKGVDRIIERIKKHRLIAGLVTNGTTLAAHAERLTQSGLDTITISIDGPEEVHDRIRGVPGAFRRTTEGIQRLEEIKRQKGAQYPTVKVNCVILPDNIPLLEETIAAVGQMGVAEMNLQHPIWDTPQNVQAHNKAFNAIMKDPQADEPRPKTQGEFFQLDMTDEKFDELQAALKRIAARKNHHPRIVFFPPVKKKELRPYYMDLRYPFERRCTSAWSMMRLLSDGSFEPCLHYTIGNVKDRPLWTLWNDPRMRRFRQNLIRRKLYPACARCCYRAY